MATLISPNGETQEVKPKNGKTFNLAELYALIGCDMVEMYVADRKTVFVWDENATFKKDAEINEAATLRLHTLIGPLRQHLLGNVLICRKTEAGF